MDFRISRRGLIAGASIATVAAGPALARELSKGVFTHGVASGDPAPDRVILWTRFATSDGTPGQLRYELSEDESFKTIAASGAAVASPFNDYCAKVDAVGLRPGRRYFYRFLSASGESPVGQTRTAPKGGKDALTLALFSCSNLPFGYFNAYGAAAAETEVDVCLHVGDYIYEYQRGAYPTADQAHPRRWIEPEGEIIRLGDYYQRYAAYRADPDLQELHRLKPFMTVWDDHELTNNAWIEGAQNHQPETEGSWADRRAAAFKAYSDWMPIRLSPKEPLRIYRRLDWGDVASILLLDTRLIGRMEQLDWQAAAAKAASQDPLDLMKAIAAFAQGPLADPKRTLLGAKQEAWFEAELKRAKARGADWAVVAQQLVMGRQVAPDVSPLLPDTAPEGVRRFVMTGAGLGKAGLEWNLDAWGGYPAARARAYAAMAASGLNVSVLAGDSHNAWLNNLKAGDKPVGVEFAGGSVSSPGFENTLTKAKDGEREAAMQGANPDLFWCDVTNRGFGLLRYEAQGLTAEWVASASVQTRDPKPLKRTKFVSAASPTGAGPWQAA